ncbi:GDSL-type esterase/lipase family protein [Lyngbya aestuarii]|uniref:GDSL-type esterase/lipase family protein n=1 Tax=Lyngbya aestuarii TaxID=118322 RepID=UPI00403D566A
MNETLKLALIFSIILNLSFVLLGLIYVSKRGGLPYLWRKLSLRQSDKLYGNPYYHDRRSHFETLINSESAIIFLGDSLTDCCEWSEIFRDKNIKNRGIAGDSTDGILQRIDEILASLDQKIFIMIGINDLIQNCPRSTIVTNYKLILEKIQCKSPKTEVFIQSVLPINNQKFQASQQITLSNEKVINLNKNLEELAQEFSFQYLDLFSFFVDENNELNAKYTSDGIHLNGQAYLLWQEIIKKDVVN